MTVTYSQKDEGDLYVTGLLFGIPIFPLFEALKEWQKWRQLDSINDEVKEQFAFSAPDGAVRPDCTHPGWIPRSF